MRAHAKLRITSGPGIDTRGPIRIPLLRSQGALVLRPTREQLPDWAARWDIGCEAVATVRLAAGAAGPLGGDHWTLDVDVADGATLMLRSVAAMLALPGAHGDESWSEVNITVGAGATLLWMPGAQIAGHGCHHVAFNRIDLEPTARLYAQEEIVMGRHGELPGDFRQRLRVTQSGAALYDQELAVGPRSAGWESAAVMGGRKAVGSIIVVDNEPTNLHGFDTPVADDNPDTAVMRLADNAVLITSLAADTVALRAQLAAAFKPFNWASEATLPVVRA